MSLRNHHLGNKYPQEPADNLAGGRLLIYLPYSNLADGAAQEASNGFFSADNEPPWDTWLCLLQDNGNDPSSMSYLISWVPRELVELVDKGINVNPEECIYWATKRPTPFVEQLRQAGLLA